MRESVLSARLACPHIPLTSKQSVRVLQRPAVGLARERLLSGKLLASAVCSSTWLQVH